MQSATPPGSDVASGSDTLKILIADDSDSDRLILQAMLRKLGHEVVTAVDGMDAVERFRTERPQIVLLDALMPRMDGREAARRIKALAGEALVPIIFLTSLSDAEELADCLAAGGDDFLSKPYNRIIIEAKINAFNRMRMMHATVQAQRDHIRERNEQLLLEQQTARRVFDNVAHRGCLEAGNIRYLMSPLSIFNGDVLFACPKPSGGMHVFLGDFTGHGLPAAIGAMPLAEIFYGMTSKGFPIADVLREINQKLKRILPTGMFCCGAMIDMNLQLQEVEIWNGGLPAGYLIRTDGSRVRLVSDHLPLGVLPAERFSPECVRYTLLRDERVLFCSDGILEATNGNEEMFGEARLLEVLDNCDSPDKVFDELTLAVRRFTGSVESRDDISLVEVAMVPEKMLDVHQSVISTGLTGPSNWRCAYELRDETLSTFNPLPLLLHICMEAPGLRLCSGQIYTILAEMFSNALEHGILRLSSTLKESASGYSRYYEERERRLKQVGNHFIRFELEHISRENGGRLLIACEDSGPGFDYTHQEESPPESAPYGGRGIMLLRQLCDSVVYCDRGNRIEAAFDWSFNQRSLGKH